MQAGVRIQSAALSLVVSFGTPTALANEFERATMADAVYRNCSGEGPQFRYEDELAYAIIAAPETDEYCHCFGEYFADLLSDSEIQHLRTFHTATAEIADKEERARAMCDALAP